MHRTACVLAALLLLLAPAAADAAKRKPKPCSKTPTAVRCLAKTRGAAPLATLPSGRVPTTAALQAFAKTFGPLPGVELRKGATGDLFDTTPVLAAIGRQRKQLTRKQRRAVDRRLAAMRRGGARAAKVTPPEGALAPWKALVDATRPQIEALYGRKLQLPPIRVRLATKQIGEVWAQADFIKEGTGRLCQIDVLPQAWGPGGVSPSSPEAKFIVAHETFHCFQFDARNGNDQNNWLGEGSANWVAGKVLAAQGLSVAGWDTLAERWDDWLTKPQTTLYKRAYDSIGFFSQLEASGADVWALLRVMLKSNDSDESYAAAGAGFLETMGPGFYREPSYGPGWDLTGPSITSAKAAVKTESVDDGETRTVTAPARTAALRELGITADVVEVDSTSAYGRLRDGAGNEKGIADGAYCARQDGCAGRPPGCAQLPLISAGQASLAIAGHTKTATVKVRGRSLEDFCKGAKPPKTSDTVMDVTGAIGQQITRNGACQRTPDSSGAIQMVFITPQGPDHVTQLTFTLKWKGPGDYERDVTFYDGLGGRAFGDWQIDTGAKDELGYAVLVPSAKVTVTSADANAIRGTISARLHISDTDSTEVQVNGHWLCNATGS